MLSGCDSRVAQGWWQEWPPAAGAFVMATGIVSIGLHLTGYEVLSWIWLTIAALVWTLLAIDFVTRFVRDRPRWASEADTPPALTAVAATTVLGTRISLLGWQAVAALLLVVAAVEWPVLLTTVLRHWHRRMPGAVFLVCVSTQGVAVLSATLATALGLGWLLYVALVFFTVGLCLYLAAFAYFDVGQVWTGAGDHWVATGALAISALAGAKLVAAHQWTGVTQDVLRVTTLIVLGLNLFGYTVLLLAEAVRPRRQYDIRRWATVFPLGMTSVAAFSTGAAIDAAGLRLLGRLLLVIAVGAWLLTLVALITDRTTFAPNRAR